jgi:hypothetical protein
MARPAHSDDLYPTPPLQLNFGGGSPLGVKVTTGGVTTIKQKPREVAPARLPSAYGGPKACTQCGTTRTPQWREGPCGPKTLCNACGVKLVRKNRGTAEAKRRTATPASSAEKGHAAVAAHFLLDRDSPSPEPWSGIESGADEAPLPPAAADFAVPQHAFTHEPSPLGQTPGQLSRRPQRKAAVKAASRTAEFASTGDWPEDEGAPAAALSDASVENSDSAEEVAWAPRQPSDDAAASAAADALGLPRNMRQETSAAINLMAMSFKDDKDGHHAAAASPPPAQPLASPQPDAGVPHQDPQAGTPRSGARLNFLRANSQLSGQEQQVEEFLRANAPARFAQYEALQAAAECSWRQSAASDAAVAAVAKFLAQKQAASIRAREAARSATQSLHSFLQDADAELGLTRAWKRQRT